MRIDPQIAALRGDPAPQRNAQVAMETLRDEWLEGPFAPVLRDLQAFGEGAGIDDCPALRQTISCVEAASGLVDPLFEAMSGVMARHPLGQVPFRHQHSDGLAMIQLARSGRATMTLLCYETLEQSPQSACFSGGECHELVLRGAGDFRLVELLEDKGPHAVLDQRVRRLKVGETIYCSGPEQARAVERVYGRLVMLRLARTDSDARPTRQYSLADGRLLHCASGTREESQREMAMALLGRMGRTDAAPLLAELSREGGTHIRWQSLRECLALDSRIGFAALSRIAADPTDELAAQAGALRAQLLEVYPVLARTETHTCPA